MIGTDEERERERGSSEKSVLSAGLDEIDGDLILNPFQILLSFVNNFSVFWW